MKQLKLAPDNSKVRVARLSNVYGIGQTHHTFLGALISDVRAKRNLLIEEDPESSKDYIEISDTVMMLEKIAINGQERIYNLASGLSTTHKDIANKLSFLTGSSVSFKVGAEYRTFPSIDISRIKKEFNFIPRYILDDLSKLVFDVEVLKK